MISEWGSDYLEDAPVKLVERQMHGERTKPDEQVRLHAEPLAATTENIATTMVIVVTIKGIVSNQSYISEGIKGANLAQHRCFVHYA